MLRLGICHRGTLPRGPLIPDAIENSTWQARQTLRAVRRAPETLPNTFRLFASLGQAPEAHSDRAPCHHGAPHMASSAPC